MRLVDIVSSFSFDPVTTFVMIMVLWFVSRINNELRLLNHRLVKEEERSRFADKRQNGFEQRLGREEDR